MSNGCPAWRSGLVGFLVVAGWLGGPAGLDRALSGELARPLELRVMSSAPGWRPTEAQIDAAVRFASRYLSARDRGDYDEAYNLMSAQLQTLTPHKTYRQNGTAFAGTAGPVRERKLVRMSWYKDPPGSPPGTYAAIDLVSRFEKIDRHCGYIVLQEASAADFVLVREDETFMDKDTARRIETEKSKDEVDRTWAQASAAHCPSERGPRSSDRR